MYAQEKIKPYSENGSKGEQVEKMFDHIAPKYDLLNHLLSFGIDKSWRRKAIDWLRPYQPAHVLDMATGTGDFALYICRKLHPAQVIGADISEGMMRIARQKVEKEGLDAQVSFRREDCMKLTFADHTFDAATVAFGARNFPDLDRGLSELCRVLRPGGKLVILELCTPVRFPMKQLFALYAKVVMPLVGKIISKDSKAYSYLPATMAAFPQGEVMQGILKKAGFSDARFKRLTGGICTLYTAVK